MKYIFLILLLPVLAFAQFSPRTFEVGRSSRALDVEEPEPRLTSNVVIDILPGPQPNEIWLGTGSGVTKLSIVGNVIPEDPPLYSFQSYSQAQGLGKGGVSALFVTDSIIWSAFAFDTTVGISGAGGGFAYSRDDGESWTWLPQPRDRLYDVDPNTGRDNVLGYWPTATNVENITYAMTMSDSFVWSASKGGGLRKHAFAENYTDYNDTTGWRVVTTTGQPFNAGQNLADRLFAVIYADSAIWTGSAAGISKSIDEGQTWQRFTADNAGISGNFVTALDYQPATNSIWAATWRAEGNSEFYAVSKTSDGGATWTVHLTEEQIIQAIGHSETPRAHGFAFDGEIVYVCDDIGLWKSIDGGESWGLFPTITDSLNSTHVFYESDNYAALKNNGLFWTGGLDGLAVSQSDGANWHIIQTALALDDPARTVDTYAYPNPYSPSRFNAVRFRVNGNGTATLSIYDFAMSKVVELHGTLQGGEDYLVWDGKKDGEIVANGTYFYKIESSSGDVWGKVIILD